MVSLLNLNSSAALTYYKPSLIQPVRTSVTNTFTETEEEQQLPPDTLNRLLLVRAQLVREIEIANKASLAEVLTCPVAVLEVLWGIAELCGTGLFSKLIYAITSGEEFFASAWVAKSIGSYTNQLKNKLAQLDSLIKQMKNNPFQAISEEQLIFIKAALNGDLRPIFDSQGNEDTNKLISLLQGGIGFLLGALAFMKFFNKDPGLFKAIENHPVPRSINSFKDKLFIGFPGKSKEVAEVTLLATPMLVMGLWKRGLAAQSMSYPLSSTLNGQSVANFTCALEAAGHGAQLLFDESSTIASLLGQTQGKDLLARPIRNLLEIPLSIWMSWNYVMSAISMIRGNQDD